MELPGEPSLVEELAGAEGRKGVAQTGGQDMAEIPHSQAWRTRIRILEYLLEQQREIGDQIRSQKVSDVADIPWFP